MASRVVIVMGIVGSGKTTVGRLLAQQLGYRFIDADDHHSPDNKHKMRRGEPLDDADRKPWLDELRRLVARALDHDQDTVLACSALKERYRVHLRVDPARVPIVYLKGGSELIASRLRGRTGHFATETLLASQIAALEEPAGAIEVDAADTPEHIVAHVRAALEHAPP